MNLTKTNVVLRALALGLGAVLFAGVLVSPVTAAGKKETAKESTEETEAKTEEGKDTEEKDTEEKDTVEKAAEEKAAEEEPAEETDPELAGSVMATRTYTVQNAMDETVTELYVYPTDSEEKGMNLAGDGLERGEQVYITVTGYMLRTENETLYTIEYTAGEETYTHTTVHVEDQLNGKVIYLVGIDGVTSATALSFDGSNLPDGETKKLEKEAIVPAPAEDTPETRGEVMATRTYTVINDLEEPVTELYVYPTGAESRGFNLAGNGLENGEEVRVTLTGYMLRTENETLYTIEYAAGKKVYGHRSVHVEDLLFDTPIYLVGVDGVSSATFLSFGKPDPEKK